MLNNAKPEDFLDTLYHTIFITEECKNPQYFTLVFFIFCAWNILKYWYMRVPRNEFLRVSNLTSIILYSLYFWQQLTFVPSYGQLIWILWLKSETLIYHMHIQNLLLHELQWLLKCHKWWNGHVLLQSSIMVIS